MNEFNNLSKRTYKYLTSLGIHSSLEFFEYLEENRLETKNFDGNLEEEVIEALQVHLGITLPVDKASKNA